MATKLSKFDHESLCRVSTARGFLGFKKDIKYITTRRDWCKKTIEYFINNPPKNINPLL